MIDPKKLVDFPVLDGVSFCKCNRVHPLMQRRMQIIMDGALKDNNVKKLVLFGSAITLRCNSWSDLDLYVERFDPSKTLDFIYDVDCNVDLLYDLNPGSRIEKEIEENGLVFLER